MGDAKAEMFNKKASSQKCKPDEIIEALGIAHGSRVLDIGAGGGYFALCFAKKAGAKGRIYAADTNWQFLEYIMDSARANGLANVETVKVSKEGGFEREISNIDLIFLRNVYHHLKNRADYFRKLKGMLRNGGKIAIIECSGGSIFSFRGLFRHYTQKKTIVNEMKNAGYEIEKWFDFLPEQSFTVFKPKDTGF